MEQTFHSLAWTEQVDMSGQLLIPHTRSRSLGKKYTKIDENKVLRTKSGSVLAGLGSFSSCSIQILPPFRINE